jgi:hypothetical protein
VDVRGEAAVRVGGLWVGGGLVRRAAAELPALLALDPGAIATTEEAATGVIGSARGRVFRGLQLDAYGIAWDTAGAYRPRYQTRAQLFFQTELRNRFPSGNFGLLASILHEYRSSAAFPRAGDVLLTPGRAQALSGLLEIRIVNAVLSYQIRNATNLRNQLVPRFQAPPATGVYGVRWEFWN